MTFSLDVLKIHPEREADRVASFVADEVKKVFRRRGVVVGLTGVRTDRFRFLLGNRGKFAIW